MGWFRSGRIRSSRSSFRRRRRWPLLVFAVGVGLLIWAALSATAAAAARDWSAQGGTMPHAPPLSP